MIDEKLSKTISSFKPQLEIRNVGYVTKLGDGIAKVSGLSRVMYHELLEFPEKVLGLALNLEEKEVGAVILGEYEKLKEGDEVKTTGKVLEIAVGEELIGRVIDPLGRPLDGKDSLILKKTMPLEKIAPQVVYRQPVNSPLQTGIKAIDAMIPIGRGQRELIIGDRGTGKTALTIDTIINQKNENIVCIYVAIGQKTSKVARLLATLEKYMAMRHTIVVAADAADPAPLQYLAPYSGCAIGEYFMKQGGDALVIYDDLTKHAWAYRQISLLLGRPSGREAYPGDIFYLHSRLLERACRIADKYGGGSLTALPIIETQAGDISAYIPTNVISITDGQIYLESDLFHAGIKPALNVGLSVSRVGGAAQTRAMKQVAGRLRLDLAQYRELVAFAQFGSELDPATKAQLERGARITEILKQPQYQPMPVEKQVAILWVATGAHLDDLPVEKIKEFETKFQELLEKEYKGTLEEIKREKKLNPEIEEKLKEATLKVKMGV